MVHCRFGDRVANGWRTTTVLAIALAVLVTTEGTAQDSQTITIPAIVIPARVIPGLHIPERRIPARRTPNGVIPEIVIPAIDIPAIRIPAINTAAVDVEIPDHAVLRQSEVRNYERSSTADQTRGTRPTYLTMAREDRDRAFAEYFPHSNVPLLSLLASADLDRSGTLSWHELHVFQRRLVEDYQYLRNSMALSPDLFLYEGGGDCEDWALMTVALARYWGWDAYVAGFFDSRSGHALALVRSPDPVPDYYFSWDIRGARTLKGDRVPDGRYVPVDYDFVGGFSSALRAGMELRHYMNPDRMYGVSM